MILFILLTSALIVIALCKFINAKDNYREDIYE